MLILLSLAGLIVGIFVVSMGGGGGSIYIGILTTMFHMSPAMAASTSLATMIPSMIMGAYSHYKQGNVDLKAGNKILIYGAVGTVVGSLLSPYIPEKIYMYITGIIIFVLGLQIMYKFLYPKKSSNVEKYGKLITIVFGLISGLMVGIVGLSGGGPIVSGLLILGLPMIKVVGTSIYVLTGTSAIGLFMHLSIGIIDWKYVIMLLIGTLLGSYLGPKILAKFKQDVLNKYLKLTMAVLLIVMGGRLLMTQFMR
ncbi:sulfite exporter TauE/SafE family protein [Clostridium sp. Mt-5]|uniref:Probable membrane transporter protein n=1 Tax=Clostridium moutaii TaxID=3240932 RepID=A0ABV4BTB3_9CLOT